MKASLKPALIGSPKPRFSVTCLHKSVSLNQ